MSRIVINANIVQRREDTCTSSHSRFLDNIKGFAYHMIHSSLMFKKAYLPTHINDMVQKNGRIIRHYKP